MEELKAKIVNYLLHREYNLNEARHLADVFVEMLEDEKVCGGDCKCGDD